MGEFVDGKKLLDIDIAKIDSREAKKFFLFYYLTGLLGLPLLSWFLGVGFLYILSNYNNPHTVIVGYVIVGLVFISTAAGYSKARYYYLSTAVVNFVMMLCQFFYFFAVILIPPKTSNDIGIYIGFKFPWNFITILIILPLLFIFIRKASLFCKTSEIDQDFVDAKNIDFNRHLFFIDLFERASLFRSLKKGTLGYISPMEKAIIAICSPLYFVYLSFLLSVNPNSTTSAKLTCIASFCLGILTLFIGIFEYRIYLALKRLDKKNGFDLKPVRATPFRFKSKIYY